MTAPPRRTLLAWSGGKDSALALHALRRTPTVEVVGLLTTVTAEYGRISMHGVRRDILVRQAEALLLPLFEVALQAGGGNAEYDAAWGDGIARAREALGDVGHVAYGDLFLEEVRQYREGQGERLGYVPTFPLWERDTTVLAREFVEAGFEAWVSCVDTTQASAELAGRRFDAAFLDSLPPSVDPCGENGEFHTCVVDGPIFARRIPIAVGARITRDDRFEYCDFTLADVDCAPSDDHHPR